MIDTSEPLSYQYPPSSPLVMGILNVTPDSFYDGGNFFDHGSAIERGFQMIEQGANIIDIGGESSRPGALPVDGEEEMRRVLPVVKELAGCVRISVDTRKASVAYAAIEEGATLLNDLSASLWPVAVQCKVGYVTMHMRGIPKNMQDSPQYQNVVDEVSEFLFNTADKARSEGLEEIWIDPGIGFGKTLQHNLSLLRHIDVLVTSNYPVLIGTSRKSFIGVVNSLYDDRAPLPLDMRLEGSIASAVWAMAAGVSMVRVHDVKATVQALKLVC